MKLAPAFRFSTVRCRPLKFHSPIRMLRLIAALALSACSGQALAYACTLSAAGVAVQYSASTGVSSSGSTITLNCTRTSSESATPTYTIAADNGLLPAGKNQNRAQIFGGSTLITYEVYRDAAVTQVWGPGGNARFSGTLNFGSAFTTFVTHTYYLRAASGQSVAAGIYQDTVIGTLYLNGSASASATATLPVSLSVPASCKISSAPGNVSFAYTSFQKTAASASTAFAILCTKDTAYTMTLDATSGTLLGLSYTLGINPVGSQSGTGFAQAASINGSIAAGQDGSCAQASCSASETRTLTVTY